MTKNLRMGFVIFWLFLSCGTLQAGGVGDLVQAQLMKMFSFNPEATEIICRPEIDSLTLTDSLNVSVSCREYPLPNGYFPLKVLLQEGNGKIRTISTSVEVRFYEKVLVAKTMIKMKSQLLPQYFTCERVETNKLTGTPLKDTLELEGQRASRTISRGKVLTDDLMEPIPVIQRGDRVRIVYDTGPLKVETVGFALKDAIKGETVEVKNGSSGRSVFGRALAEGIVVVER